MKSTQIAFTLLLAVLFGLLLTSENKDPEITPTTVQAAEVEPTKEEIFFAKWNKLTYKEKVEWNPNDCDIYGNPPKQLLRADNGNCGPRDPSVWGIQAPVSRSKPPTGDWVARCHKWAKEAGIVLNSAAIKLLERESHCNPSAWNASSGAGGIPQALPFSKTGCQLGTAGAVCQLKWFKTYVMSRYGSYQAALNHSYSHNWY